MRRLGLITHNPERAHQGYTLFAPLTGETVYLLDMDGAVVHRWDMPYRPASYGYLLEDGHLLYGGVTGRSPVTLGGRGGIVMEVDWDGNLFWEYEEGTLHHDFHRLPNNNTMVLAWEPVPPEIQGRIVGGMPGTEHEQGVWGDVFREITPEGKAVWEWHSHEHLDPEGDPMCPLESREEWGHANACNVLPNGNLLTSFRRLNTVVIIDKVSGGFLWKWGRQDLGHQHDPTQLENGNVLVFDNGWHGSQSPSAGSRVIEVNPRTNEIAWSYQTRPPWDFFSSFLSGAQRLPNGNTLVCAGMTGRLLEVTLEGDVVWEYVNPFFGDDERFGRSNHVFRAYRYPPDFPGLRDKPLDPARYAWLNHLYESARK